MALSPQCPGTSPAATITEVWRSSTARARGDVETAYPYERYGSSPQAAIVQSDADHSVICPTQRIARSLADALGPASVRAYAFSHHTRNGCDWGAELDVVDDDASPWPSEQLGWATHRSDVAYTFGALAGPEPLNYSRVLCPMNADERELNAKMMSFWADFARGGHAAIDTKTVAAVPQQHG